MDRFSYNVVNFPDTYPTTAEGRRAALQESEIFWSQNRRRNPFQELENFRPKTVEGRIAERDFIRNFQASNKDFFKDAHELLRVMDESKLLTYL